MKRASALALNASVWLLHRRKRLDSIDVNWAEFATWTSAQQKKINSHRDDLFLRCLWVKLDDRESEYRFNMSQRLVVPNGSIQPNIETCKYNLAGHSNGNFYNICIK